MSEPAAVPRLPDPAPGPEPGAAAGEYGLPARVQCPFCHTAERTELHSPFGPQLSVATYWCHRCRTAFDYLRRR